MGTCTGWQREPVSGSAQRLAETKPSRRQRLGDPPWWHITNPSWHLGKHLLFFSLPFPQCRSCSPASRSLQTPLATGSRQHLGGEQKRKGSSCHRPGTRCAAVPAPGRMPAARGAAASCTQDTPKHPHCCHQHPWGWKRGWRGCLTTLGARILGHHAPILMPCSNGCFSQK